MRFIEMIRKNAKKNNENDMCRWFFVSPAEMNTFRYRAECHQEPIFLDGLQDLDYRFCPYCGRKIKRIM